MADERGQKKANGLNKNGVNGENPEELGTGMTVSTFGDKVTGGVLE